MQWKGQTSNAFASIASSVKASELFCLPSVVLPFDSLGAIDPVLKSISLLGTLPNPEDVGSDELPAILIIQKTPFDGNDSSRITGLFDRTEVIEANDIVRACSHRPLQ